MIRDALIIGTVSILLPMALRPAAPPDSSAPGNFPVLTGPYLGQEPPGAEPEMFAPGIVTLLDEMNHNPPVFSPDGTEVYWSELSGNPYYSKIKFSRLLEGRWTEPRFVPFSSDIDGGPVLSADGNMLFFASWRPEEGGAPSVRARIWRVVKNDAGWSEPQVLPPEINAREVRWQFSVAAGGNLYLDSQNGLLLSHRTGSGYEKPVKVSAALHPSYDGITPFIAPDESFLIFASSDLPGCLGETDLYAGFRGEDGAWSDPVHLPDSVNSPGHDICPMLTSDGKYLFFISRRTGEYHVYWVKADFLIKLATDAR
jgi:Tol biopolymer transport system component